MLRFRRRPRPGPLAAADIDCGSATDIGRRPENQDRVEVAPRWAVLADGMGGHAGGGLAATLAVDAAAAVLRSAAGDRVHLEDAVRRANAAIRTGQRADNAVWNMGATLTAAVAVDGRSDRWLVASIGDSPAWLVTADRAEQVTVDHNVARALGGTAFRHVLLRSLGTADEATADLVEVYLASAEALVLASDGITEALGVDDVHRVVTTSTRAAEAADRLVGAALAAGTTDNVTVAVLLRMAASGSHGVAHPGPAR